jgi:hypothetical protein
VPRRETLARAFAGLAVLMTPIAVVAATAAPAAAVPELTVTSPSGEVLDLGSVELGTTAVESITIENTGDEALQLVTWRLDGPFDLAGVPDLTPVAPEATREFDIEFAAASPGPTTGSFVLDYVALFQGQLVVDLKAIGGAAPEATTTTIAVAPTVLTEDLATTGNNDRIVIPAALLVLVVGSLVLATHPRPFRRP